jgi:hypothetical protein
MSKQLGDYIQVDWCRCGWFTPLSETIYFAMAGSACFKLTHSETKRRNPICPKCGDDCENRTVRVGIWVEHQGRRWWNKKTKSFVFKEDENKEMGT